jgi:hypothetical protein
MTSSSREFCIYYAFLRKQVNFFFNPPFLEPPCFLTGKGLPITMASMGRRATPDPLTEPLISQGPDEGGTRMARRISCLWVAGLIAAILFFWGCEKPKGVVKGTSLATIIRSHHRLAKRLTKSPMEPLVKRGLPTWSVTGSREA